jgi:hypothetical protein
VITCQPFHRVVGHLISCDPALRLRYSLNHIIFSVGPDSGVVTMAEPAKWQLPGVAELGRIIFRLSTAGLAKINLLKNVHKL